MAGRVLLVGKRAWSFREILGASARGLHLEEADGVKDAAERVRRSPPDVALVAASDPAALQAVEALFDGDATGTVAVLVVTDAPATPQTAGRMVALGARLVAPAELELRYAIDEALATRVQLEGRRVVVADDDPAITWFFADLLRAEGCVVEDVLDGAEALDRALAAPPDLVVADLLMPGLDGTQLLRRMREDPVLRDVPVILLSWKDDWLEQVRQSRVDAWGYLAKRSEPGTVLTRVRSALAGQARLEARMRRQVTVRGDVEETTAHRILETAGHLRPDCRVSIRHGDCLYDLQLRAGRPRCATRSSLHGDVLRGPSALAAALVLDAGRFVVAVDRSEVRGELQGTCESQLAEQIARLREGWRPEEVVPVAAQAVFEPTPAPAPCAAPADLTEPTLAGPLERTVPTRAEVTVDPGPCASPEPTAPMPSVTAPLRPTAGRIVTRPIVLPPPPPSLAREPSPRPRPVALPMLTPVAPRPEPRTWRAPWQAAALVAVAVAGLAAGATLRVLGADANADSSAGGAVTPAAGRGVAP